MFVNTIECKSCIEKIKVNSECCFVGLKIIDYSTNSKNAKKNGKDQ